MSSIQCQLCKKIITDYHFGGVCGTCFTFIQAQANQWNRMNANAPVQAPPVNPPPPPPPAQPQPQNENHGQLVSYSVLIRECLNDKQLDHFKNINDVFRALKIWTPLGISAKENNYDLYQKYMRSNQEEMIMNEQEFLKRFEEVKMFAQTFKNMNFVEICQKYNEDYDAVEWRAYERMAKSTGVFDRTAASIYLGPAENDAPTTSTASRQPPIFGKQQ